MKRLALTLSIAAGPVAADPCPPIAIVTGDAGAVASIDVELKKLGVEVWQADRPGACKKVYAKVEVAPAGYTVTIDHRSSLEARTVGDAVVAATWIDSWAHDDFGESVTTAKLASSPIVAGPELVQAVEVDPRPRAIDVSAQFDQAWTTDGQRWSGITAGACARFGAWCFGAKARYAGQSELYGQTAAKRTDLAALATASHTTTIGRLQLVPELGLGAGRSSTTRIDGCRRVQTCDPDDPHCSVPMADIDCINADPEHAYTLKLDDKLSASTLTPRAAASVRVAVSLAKDWWLDGVASAMLAPFAHRDPFQLPAGTPMPYGIPADQLALPGESLATFELGIGLRWGAPL